MKKSQIIFCLLVLDLLIVSASALDICRYDNGDGYVEDRIFYLMDNYGQQGLPIISSIISSQDDCIDKVVSSADSIMILDVAKICTINPVRNGKDIIDKYNALISSGYYSPNADITQCYFPEGYNVTLQNAKQDWINDYCRHNKINITKDCVQWIAFEKKNRGIKPMDTAFIAIGLVIIALLLVFYIDIKKIKEKTRFKSKK